MEEEEEEPLGEPSSEPPPPLFPNNDRRFAATPPATGAPPAAGGDIGDPADPAATAEAMDPDCARVRDPLPAAPPPEAAAAALASALARKAAKAGLDAKIEGRFAGGAAVVVEGLAVPAAAEAPLAVDGAGDSGVDAPVA
jgi:hypothetical protein